MMNSISPSFLFAFKSLLHDRVKAIAAILGISFSVLLSLIQTGMYLGYMENASSVIDHSTADLWVMKQGTENFDVAQAMDERYYYKVYSISGVARVEKMILGGTFWKTPKGGFEGPQVIGLERDPQMLRPWNIVEGSFEVLEKERSVIMDRTDMKKLGVEGLGHRTEMWGQRATVRGFTEGIRSFITAPVVFTSLKDARRFCHLEENQVVYLLVKLDSQASPERVKKEMKEGVKNIDVYTRQEFSARTRNYWSRTTGVGVALFTSAFMGMVIGVGVVSLTLYMSISDHLKEYGTLKAVGVSNQRVITLIGYQSLLLGFLGCLLGYGATWILTRGIVASGINVILPAKTVTTLLSMILLLCYLSSFLAVRKVLKLEPILVFQR
ncbi:MAG: ABC transporter permease [Chlamydiae bacterium]|nr:ABC transporter permease [Chlamydiota bacterium]